MRTTARLAAAAWIVLAAAGARADDVPGEAWPEPAPPAEAAPSSGADPAPEDVTTPAERLAEAAEAVVPPELASVAWELTLDEAIAIALHGNPAVRVARHGLASAQSGLRAAENRFDWKLETAFSDDRAFERQQSITLPGAMPGDPDVTFVRDLFSETDSLTLRLSKGLPIGGEVGLRTDLTRARTPFATDGVLHAGSSELEWLVPLWGGSGRRVATADLVAARTGLANGSRALVESETRLVLEATRAFYQVARTRRFLEIDVAALARARENLRTYGLRLEEGLITPIDVARAERELRSRENAVVSDEESLVAARDRLMVLLGLPPGTEFALQEGPAPEVGGEEVALEDAVTEAFEQRTDLRIARDALALDELAVHLARSATRPRVDLRLSAGVTLVGGDEPSGLFDLRDDDSWSSGVAVGYTFGERTDDEALLRARIAQEQARIALEDLERGVELEVRDAVRAVRSLERQVELLRRNLELAQEALRLAELSLEESLIETTDLLQIQDDLVRAETDLAAALYDLEVARVQLDLARGRYVTAGSAQASTFLGREPLPVLDVPVRLVPAAEPPERLLRPRRTTAPAVVAPTVPPPPAAPGSGAPR